jgi:hemerythrin superfamily protein
MRKYFGMRANDDLECSIRLSVRALPADPETSVISACRIATPVTASKTRAPANSVRRLQSLIRGGSQPMNAIDLLETQHRDIDTLFERLHEVQGAARQPLFNDVADLLAIHSSLEELHFYPSVNAADTEEILKRSLEEHLGVKRKLSLCMVASIGSDDFMRKLQELADEVRHHVQEERTELFPKVQQLMNADQLEALGQEMTSTMAQLQQGHPRFDVPLQTLAPMPLTDPLPAQSGIGSRVIPHIGRLLALPLQILGALQSVRRMGEGFVRGLRRGLDKSGKRHA